MKINITKNRIIIYVLLVIFLTLFNFYFRPVEGNKLVTKEYKSTSAYINDLYMSDEYFKKNILDEDSYYIYDELIKGSLNDESTIKIKCNSDCSDKLINSYYALYLDHPELISFVGISYYKIEDGMLIIDNYGNLSKLKYFLGTRRIERELDIIKRETKNMTDKEKIIYTYEYVASHNYDRLFTFMKSNQSAYSFFTGGSSVCAGFAKASQLIFQNIGIKSYLVLSSDHMWNYVEYNGKYYVFDATVGASYRDKKNVHFYDGLGYTTINNIYGLYSYLYPSIEDEPLMYTFGL